MIILYVEDCEISVELFSHQLGHHSRSDEISLDVAETVSDAIQMFSAETHGAALIDWNLPDGEGIEVARHIRGVTETLPIIFLSAVMTEEYIAAANSFNPKACLTKGHGKTYIGNILQLISQDQQITLSTDIKRSA